MTKRLSAPIGILLAALALPARAHASDFGGYFLLLMWMAAAVPVGVVAYLVTKALVKARAFRKPLVFALYAIFAAFAAWAPLALLLSAPDALVLVLLGNTGLLAGILRPAYMQYRDHPQERSS